MVVQLTHEQYSCFLSDFVTCDTNGDGQLEKNEVVGMLRRQLGKEPTDGQASALIRQLDRDNSGTISFEEYVTALCNGEKYEVSRDKHPWREGEVIEAVAVRLQAYGINTCQIPGLFSRSDPNATGLMTPEQIGECFILVGVHLSKRELDRVAKWGETKHRDQIEYQRVMDKLLEIMEGQGSKLGSTQHVLAKSSLMLGMNLRSKLIRNLLREKISVYCEQSGRSLEDIFHEADEMSTGSLDTNDLLNVCILVHFKINWDELEQVLFNADKDNASSLDMARFIQFCRSSKGQFTHENGAKASLCKHIQSKWKIPDNVTDPELLLGLMKDFSKRQEMLSRALTALTTAFVKDGNTSMQHAFTGTEIREWVANALGTATYLGALTMNELGLQNVSMPVADWIDLCDSLIQRPKTQNGRLSESLDEKLLTLQQKLREIDAEHLLHQSVSDLEKQRDGCCHSCDQDLTILNEFLFNSSVGYGDMKSKFKDIDSDRNGKLSVSEVYRNMRDMGLDVSPTTAIRVFSHFDKNNNSEVTFEEYSKAWSAFDDDSDEAL